MKITKTKKRRMCAVCGDKHQSNVLFAWKRHSDGIIFWVCAACAEGHSGHHVTADTVQIKENKTYSTFLSE